MMRRIERTGPDNLQRRSFLFGSRSPAAGTGQTQSDRHVVYRALPHDERAVARYAFVPVFNEEKCTGCDACVRLCPHGALELQRQNTARAYVIHAQRCTGCDLCVDICQEQAIVTVPTAAVNQQKIPLKEGLCDACGNGFHLPAAQTSYPRFCPICLKTGNNRNLYQVY